MSLANITGPDGRLVIDASSVRVNNNVINSVVTQGGATITSNLYPFNGGSLPLPIQYSLTITNNTTVTFSLSGFLFDITTGISTADTIRVGPANLIPVAYQPFANGALQPAYSIVPFRINDVNTIARFGINNSGQIFISEPDGTDIPLGTTGQINGAYSFITFSYALA